jgi:hypothetical protein
MTIVPVPIYDIVPTSNYETSKYITASCPFFSEVIKHFENINYQQAHSLFRL